MFLVMLWKKIRSLHVWLRMKILGRRECVEIRPLAKEEKHMLADTEISEEKYLPEIVKQTRQAVAEFELHARRLLQFHHASLFQKLLLKMRYKFARSHSAVMKEGRKIINSASTNANNIQQMLQKYEKMKLSTEGNKWKQQLHDMRVRLIFSRWLVELIAIYITSVSSQSLTPSPLAQTFSCCFESEAERNSFSVTLTDSLKIELDLTCPICLETLFDPVSLGCGHVFCFSCACDAASVLPLEGLQSACKNSKCPSCRKKGVYVGVLHLKGLNILIKKRCKEQWQERRGRERVQRLVQAKEYWNGQMALVMFR